MKKFSVSGLTTRYRFLKELVNIPDEWIKDDVIIDSVFGNFPYVIFSGGRYIGGQKLTKMEMKKRIDFFNSNDIGVNYTYSNPFIQKKHLKDYYANKTLEIADNEMNGIILNSNVLRNYLTENFPNFNIIQSCTANTLDTDRINRMCNNSDIVVIPPEMNNQDKRIERLDGNIEVLVNERCVPFCEKRDKHYEEIAKCYLMDVPMSKLKNFRAKKHGVCPRNENNIDQMKISNKRIEELHSKGIKYFKLVGRNESLGYFINSLSEYIIRDNNETEFLRKMNMVKHKRGDANAMET